MEVDEVCICELPPHLLAVVLQQAAEGSAAKLCALQRVCRAWREAAALAWCSITSLAVISPGGCFGSAPSLVDLSIGALSGVGDGDELRALCSCSPRLSSFMLSEVVLSPGVLATLLSTALVSLSLINSRCEASALSAVLRSGRLRILCLARTVVRNGKPLLSALRCATSLTVLDVGRAQLGSVLDSAAVSSLAAALPLLERLDLSGSESLTCIPLALLEHGRLRALILDDSALSGSATAAELDLAQNACFPALSTLSIAGCRGLRSAGIRALAYALGQGHVPFVELRASRLLDLEDADGARLLAALRLRGIEGGMDVDISTSGRLSALLFAELACQNSLTRLCASGLPQLTPAMLMSLAESGSLDRCAAIELADCEQLKGAAASFACARACVAAGIALRVLVLDGCWLDDADAITIAHACPLIDRMSLVGIPSLGDAGLSALVRRTALTSLTLGGRARWTPAALVGCSSLRSMRLVRCGRFDEGELCDVLTCSRGLVKLAVGACGSLTDDGLARLAAELPLLRSVALHAEDHPSLLGKSLHRFQALRSLTLRGCPSIQACSIVRLAASVPLLVELCIPHDLQCALFQNLPVRAEPDACEDRPWRPQPRLRMRSS
jgi:hypothetical protein